MKSLDGLIENLSRVMDRLAGLCIVLMMLLIVSNIILRAVFKQPLVGAVDYVNILIALTIGLSIAYCAVQDGHIAIGFIMDKMPAPAAAVIEIIINLIALVFWGFVTWYMIGFAQSMNANGLVASTSQIPLSPVVYVIALGLMAICLVLLSRLAQCIYEGYVLWVRAADDEDNITVIEFIDEQTAMREVV
ncbi:MAG TPA: TRAP transporter small permease [Gelria sp.]|nr:TRAP transporter small permease [Gelria sp.]